MSFELGMCTDADMDRAFTVISDAFGRRFPYFEYCFPAHDTPAGRKAGAERMRTFKNSDPNTHFVKAVSTETGDIVGVAKWNIYDGVVPDEIPLEGNFWENKREKELANEMWAGYLKNRREAVKDTGGRIVSLDILTVDPAYQRKGVGRMLVRWGTDIADRMGVKGVVEATPEGCGLYAQEGFQVEIDKYTVQLSEKFADRETQSYTWMVRPAKN